MKRGVARDARGKTWWSSTSGRIWAESAGPGKGARFSFELPILVAARDQREPMLEESGVQESSLVGLRALLVDDEQDTRELTARVLRKAGAEVVRSATRRPRWRASMPIASTWW